MGLVYSEKQVFISRARSRAIEVRALSIILVAGMLRARHL